MGLSETEVMEVKLRNKPSHDLGKARHSGKASTSLHDEHRLHPNP